jgi:hypothetical protein
VLFSHGLNKAFLVPDSCRATERDSNSISDDVTKYFGTSYLKYINKIMFRVKQHFQQYHGGQFLSVEETGIPGENH